MTVVDDASSKIVAERPIVVTGAASGMGRATADALGRRGHPLVLIDRDAGGLRHVASELSHRGVKAVAAAADVSRREDLEAAFDTGHAAFGDCYGAAVAAGFAERSTVIDATESHISRLVATNFVGVVSTIQLAVRQMLRRRDGGRVVALASDVVYGGAPEFGTYAATKAAVASLVRTLAVELGRYGVTVNAVAPGIIDTPLAAGLSQEEKDAAAAAIPIERWGSPAEVASLVTYLVSDDAGYLSGETILIDGAATAAMNRTI